MDDKDREFLHQVKKELDNLEAKVNSLEEVLDKHIFEDLSVLKMKIAVLEERSATNQKDVQSVGSQLIKLRDDVNQLLKYTNEVKDILDNHVIEENKDRVTLFRGILLTIFTVIFTAAINYFANQQ